MIAPTGSVATANLSPIGHDARERHLPQVGRELTLVTACSRSSHRSSAMEPPSTRSRRGDDQFTTSSPYLSPCRDLATDRLVVEREDVAERCREARRRNKETLNRMTWTKRPHSTAAPCPTSRSASAARRPRRRLRHRTSGMSTAKPPTKPPRTRLRPLCLDLREVAAAHKVLHRTPPLSAGLEARLDARPNVLATDPPASAISQGAVPRERSNLRRALACSRAVQSIIAGLGVSRPTAQQSIYFHAAARSAVYRQPGACRRETQRLLAAGQLKGLVFLHFVPMPGFEFTRRLQRRPSGRRPYRSP